MNSIKAKEQSSEQKHYTRPKGLWVSVVGDRDWPSMNPGDLRSQHQYEITLKDENKIRFIDGRKQLSEFIKKYGLKPRGEPRIAIDWVKVATEHQGLIIAPYIAEHTRYPTLFWYGAWGCASGCIWNKDAISEIKLIREAEPFWWFKENPRLPKTHNVPRTIDTHVFRGHLQGMPPGCPDRHSGIPFPVNYRDVPDLWREAAL